MKVLLALFALLALSQAISYEDLVKEEWETFKIEHKKKYTNEIDELRLKIYMENKHLIATHNAKYEQNSLSYKLKLNKFGDMLQHEIASKVNGFNKTSGKMLLSAGAPILRAKYVEPAHVTLPSHVDWRKSGAVTPIKDQGHCGSCWAFSTTGALEAQHFRVTGVLVSLSEQNLIDCSGKYGNNGCNGGLMDGAFEYIKENKGLDTEKSYPYEAVNDKCRYNPKNNGAADVGFVDIPNGDEDKLKAAVATVGPVSIAIDASLQTFQFYSEGVYYDSECSSTNLDHGVLVVGYGTDESGQDYWLVKNSWGEKWGDKGYIKMARNKNNHCGIASSASYPLV